MLYNKTYDLLPNGDRRPMTDIKVTKYIKKLLVLILLFIGLFIVIFCFLRHKNTSDELIFVLDNNELLIDYTLEEPLAYALVNKKGISQYGDFFVLFEREDKAFNRIYENDFKDLMPWKIEVADIDADNTKEILIAVNKTTHLDKEIKNRMFIFNYQDNILVKKWTGSQIAGVWRNFYVGDLLSAPGDELIFIQELDGGKEKVSIYLWFDFSFMMIAESEAYHKIKDIAIVGDNQLRIEYYAEENEKKGQELEHILTSVNGKLVIKDDK